MTLSGTPGPGRGRRKETALPRYRMAKEMRNICKSTPAFLLVIFLGFTLSNLLRCASPDAQKPVSPPKEYRIDSIISHFHPLLRNEHPDTISIAIVEGMLENHPEVAPKSYQNLMPGCKLLPELLDNASVKCLAAIGNVIAGVIHLILFYAYFEDIRMVFGITLNEGGEVQNCIQMAEETLIPMTETSVFSIFLNDSTIVNYRTGSANDSLVKQVKGWP